MREKIYRSLNSSDLTQEEWESAAHVVASIGAAQINRGHLTLGAMLLRLRAGQAQFLPRIIALTTHYVCARAKRDRWVGVTRQRARIIVETALDHFLDENCQVCNGVGTIGELGQVIVLCSRKNGGCGGTGRRELKLNGWMERVKDVLAAFGAWEGHAAGATRWQARGRVSYNP